MADEPRTTYTALVSVELEDVTEDLMHEFFNRIAGKDFSLTLSDGMVYEAKILGAASRRASS